MQYTQTKQYAAAHIEKLVKTGQKIKKVILYHELMLKYGLGKKFVNEHLEILEERGLIDVSEKEVELIKAEKSKEEIAAEQDIKEVFDNVHTKREVEEQKD